MLCTLVRVCSCLRADCVCITGFDVAMQRDKYPERVPFRLTRMLVNAMEVSGIEGNFRFTVCALSCCV